MFKRKKKSFKKLLVTYNNFEIIVGTVMIVMQIILIVTFYHSFTELRDANILCGANSEGAANPEIIEP
ncbi:MAG: hypothetical protein WCW77_00820 [Patescibacteria group bacterium]|jgi:hypothetical protein